jgi:predicted kinase
MIPNDKKNALILLVGISGSGKSTWGKKFSQDNNITYLSSDEYRAKFGKNEDDQSVTPQVFAYLKRKVDELLSQGKSVMVDATNLTKRDRKDFLDSANKTETYKIAVVFEVSRDELVARQEKRASVGGRRVPDWVIDKMINKYQRPDETEFDKVINK